MHQRNFSTIAVAIAACTILASQIAMYRHGATEQQTLQWIARSYQVIQDLQSIDDGLRSAQSALQVYAHGRDARAASSFADALSRIRSAYLEAQGLTWEDAEEHRLLHELAPLIAHSVGRLSVAFTRELSDPLAAPRGLDEAIGRAIGSEQQLLVQRVRASDATHARARTIAIISASLALSIIMLVFLLLRRQGAELSRSALIDELTGLYNRRGFTLMAEHRMRLADRHGQPLHLLFIDLDDMKQINDQLGHDAGDAALVQTARLLESVFRESDVVARLGGDEFVVLAEGDADADLNLHDRFHHAIHLRERAPSLSVGFALYEPGKLTSLAELLGQADAAMYKHKRRGKRERPLLALTKEPQS